MDEPTLRVILIPSAGALLQEVIHWHGLRQRLEEARYRRLLRSPAYWVITAAMIIGTGFGAWAWFDGHQEPIPARTLMLFGFAFPLIVKKAAASLVPGESAKGFAPVPHKRSEVALAVRAYLELPESS